MLALALVAAGAGPAQAQTCTPVPCGEVKVGLPYSLGFSSDHGKIKDAAGVGTGFTWFARTRTGGGYIPANLTMDRTAGRLRVRTTKGLAYSTDDAQDNMLGVGVDARTGKVTLKTTLVSPPVGSKNYEQAGLWLGRSQSEYDKLVVASTPSGTRVEHTLEVGNSLRLSALSYAYSMSSARVELTLVADPADRSLTGSFRINGGAARAIGRHIAPPELFSLGAAAINPAIGTATFAGIMASHRRGPAPLTYLFDDFSVTGTSSPPPGPSELLPDLRQEPPFGLVTRAEGSRTFLGFGSAVNNAGSGRLVIHGSRAGTSTPRMSAAQVIDRSDGSTTTGPASMQFEFSPSSTHNHWHLLDFDRFELRSMTSGALVTPGRKTGFCLGYLSNDLSCGRGQTAWTSLQMGIPVGRSDDYDAFVEGQDVELTGLASGRYCLGHRANVTRSIKESGYGNNEASLVLDVQWPSGGGLPTVAIRETWSGTGTCGLATASSRRGRRLVRWLPAISRAAASRYIRRAVKAETGRAPRSLSVGCTRATRVRIECSAGWNRTRSARVTLWHRRAKKGAIWLYRFRGDLRARGRGGKVSTRAFKLARRPRASAHMSVGRGGGMVCSLQG